ncbi:MAG: PHP domain-containing protein [Gemmatimonadales bacterium]
MTQVADLHAHSTASDGINSPTEVVRLAARAGLTALALTDHDTVDGVAEARIEGDLIGVKVLSGCEFSVLGDWGEMHLLAYGMPEGDAELEAAFRRMRTNREERGRAMVAAIAKCGVPLDYAEVEGVAAGAPIGRPHVARALMARGVVRTVDEAFVRFLGRGKVAYVGKALPTLEEITDLIRRVGGVSSLAHPRDRANRAALRGFQARGLDGVEVRHPSHSPSVRAELERVANELGLLMTGGSDSHGELSPSSTHNLVGGERIPIEWVDAIERLAASRRP